MSVDYRWDPFANVSTSVSISNEAHIIPSSSPFTVRLEEVPMRDTPSTLVIKVKDILTAAITTSGEKSITVTNGAWFATGAIITIDSEQMYVSGVASNRLTVTRGYNGTTATTHILGTAVYVESSMSEVEAIPTEGQFWPDYSTGANGQNDWNTGTILFNAADAGKTVVVSYVGTGTLVDTRTTHGQAVFTSSGVWICPEGITEVFVSMCGGGGGGGASSSSSVEVAGSAGGNSSFGSLLTTNGGGGGGGASRSSVGAAGSAGGKGGTSGGKGYVGNGSVISGCGGSCILGAGGSPVSSTGAGLPGAGFGAGGSGGAYTSGVDYRGAAGGGGGAHSYLKQPVTVIPTTEYIITIGAGGAGGVQNYNGGNGTPGICIIEW